MWILKKLRTDHDLLCICLGLVEIRKFTVQKQLWPTILFRFSALCISSFLFLQSLLQQLDSNKFQTSCVLSLYIISLVLSGCHGGGRPFHPSVPSSVPSSIHPSSSSQKKMMEEEEEKLL